MPASRLTVDLDERATEAKNRIPYGFIKPIIWHFMYKIGEAAQSDYDLLFHLFSGRYKIVAVTEPEENADGHD